MKRCEFDIIKHHPTFAGNRFSFRHKPAILILALYAEYPFLFRFFAFDNSYRPADRYCQKDDHFVFNPVFIPFHNRAFLMVKPALYQDN